MYVVIKLIFLAKRLLYDSDLMMFSLSKGTKSSTWFTAFCCLNLSTNPFNVPSILLSILSIHPVTFLHLHLSIYLSIHSFIYSSTDSPTHGSTQLLSNNTIHLNSIYPTIHLPNHSFFGTFSLPF
jgi:hypothetical protein